MNDEENMKNKIELQLHEQYAVNNNANVNSIITFIVGIVAVLGAYGSVFINIGKYNYEDLAFVSVGCLFVLGVISFVCIEVGARQRSEQFIIHAIRHNAYDSNPLFIDDDNKGIFIPGYHPFGKRILKFVQGIFNTFWIVSSIIALLIASHFRFISPDVCLKRWVFVSFVIYCIIILSYLWCKFTKYYKLQKKFDFYNPTSDNEKKKYDQNVKCDKWISIPILFLFFVFMFF